MPDDLGKLFGELADRVPVTPDETFEFTEDMLPVPPPQLETDRLFIEKHVYRYGGYYQVDSIWFHADYSTFRHLALLILSAIFHAEPSPVRLDLTHPTSDIKHLMVEYNYKELGWRGFYYPRPYKVRHYVAPFDEISMGNAGVNPMYLEDRPSFRLTNLEDSVSWEEYEHRNTVWLYGNDRANVLIADYLLNIGRAEEPHGMYRIEGSGEEGSYLGYQSAEVRFILPGHSYWREDEWPAEEKES